MCEFTWQEDWKYIWQQIKVDRCNVDYEWEHKAPTQRVYDFFHNEWDLMVLFDCRRRNPGWRWQFP